MTEWGDVGLWDLSNYCLGPKDTHGQQLILCRFRAQFSEGCLHQTFRISELERKVYPGLIRGRADVVRILRAERIRCGATDGVVVMAEIRTVGVVVTAEVRVVTRIVVATFAQSPLKFVQGVDVTL